MKKLSIFILLAFSFFLNGFIFAMNNVNPIKKSRWVERKKNIVSKIDNAFYFKNKFNKIIENKQPNPDISWLCLGIDQDIDIGDSFNGNSVSSLLKSIKRHHMKVVDKREKNNDFISAIYELYRIMSASIWYIDSMKNECTKFNKKKNFFFDKTWELASKVQNEETQSLFLQSKSEYDRNVYLVKLFLNEIYAWTEKINEFKKKSVDLKQKLIVAYLTDKNAYGLFVKNYIENSSLAEKNRLLYYYPIDVQCCEQQKKAENEMLNKVIEYKKSDIEKEFFKRFKIWLEAWNKKNESGGTI